MKARYLLANGETLSKRIVHWRVPDNLAVLSRKNKKTYIGIGKWININRKYCVIAKNGELIYLEKELLKVINRELLKRR